jgi:NADH-quinone oxidoreductase subunit L
LLTAFYMTRQVFYVFFGNCRLHLGKTTSSEQRTMDHAGVAVKQHPHHELAGGDPHESPVAMTMPLVILAACSILLGFLGTPAWPWFQKFLGGEEAEGFSSGVISLMVTSSVIVFIGIGLGWWLYGRKPLQQSEEMDPLEKMRPDIFGVLRHKYYIDEVYEHTVIAFNAWFARACDALDFWVWNGLVQLVGYAVVGFSWVSNFFDIYVVNGGFDEGCENLSASGRLLSLLQNGRVQSYLRVIGIALAALALLLIWGHPS